ncbi:ARM repeat superfamily protein [Perilla frutescens var. hirtella]|nr:ARM repeat superfamily protein [Perilla frutescens var. hirtella]
MSVHPQPPKRSDSFTNWFFAYTKLRFFTRMRRLLHLNGVVRNNKPPEKSMNAQKAGRNEEETAAGKSEGHDGWMVALQTSVKKLHFGSWEEKEAAAEEIRKLAEEDLKRRKKMAELGVIPPLVAMAGSDVVARRRLAVRALVELANGSFTNKALMVEAGILSNLPENIGDFDETVRQEFAQLLLCISSLANSQFPLNSTAMIPAVVSILHSNSITTDTKHSCIATLYNLSTVLDNAGALIAAGVVTALLTSSSVKSVSEKCLAALGNLVMNLAGRKELEQNPMMPENLIETMTWGDKPKCQESSAYILMVLAHQSSLQRRKMVAAGAVEVLLEVALLGSPLAQKRALRILELFRDERSRRIGPHSGPLMGRTAVVAPVNRRSGDEGRRLMKKIVKQSLYKNMEIITRRANGGGGGGGGDCSKVKALVVSSSSKSLPY